MLPGLLLWLYTYDMTAAYGSAPRCYICCHTRCRATSSRKAILHGPAAALPAHRIHEKACSAGRQVHRQKRRRSAESCGGPGIRLHAPLQSPRLGGLCRAVSGGACPFPRTARVQHHFDLPIVWLVGARRGGPPVPSSFSIVGMNLMHARGPQSQRRVWRTSKRARPLKGRRAAAGAGAGGQPMQAWVAGRPWCRSKKCVKLA